MSDQIETAAAAMTRDYLILAFLVSLGSLQIAVSISGIRGLWLLPNRILTRALGIILIITGIATYILSPMWIEGPWAAGTVTDGTSAGRSWGTATFDEISGARNLNDIHGGMAGTAYAGFFILSAVLATLFAAAIGTINTRLLSPSRSEGDAWSEAITKGVPETSNPHPSAFPSFREGVGAGREQIPDGLDALKHTNAISTLTASLHALRRTGSQDIRNLMRSAHRWSIPSIVERTFRN